MSDLVLEAIGTLALCSPFLVSFGLYYFVPRIRAARNRLAYHEAISILEYKPIDELVEWLVKAHLLWDDVDNTYSLTLGGVSHGGKLHGMNLYDLGKILGSLITADMVDIDDASDNILRYIKNADDRKVVYEAMVPRHSYAAERLAENVRLKKQELDASEREENQQKRLRQAERKLGIKEKSKTKSAHAD